MATTIYRLKDGTRVPSVTTILGAVIAKPALVGWANKLGLQGIKVGEQLDELADIGTAVHELAKASLSNRAPNLPVLNPDQLTLATNCYNKFTEWQAQHKYEPLDVEMKLISEELGYGGTTDALCNFYGRLDEPTESNGGVPLNPSIGVLELWDFKTGKAIYDDYLFQLAAYARAARENGHNVQRIRIIRIGRNEDEGFEQIVVDGKKLELAWTVFLHALHIYRAQHELEYLSRGGGKFAASK